MHIIREGGGCEGCSIWYPGDSASNLLPDLLDLFQFDRREKDPPLHEVFIVRLETGELAAVCCYCHWGVRFGLDGGRLVIGEIAVGHIKAQRLRCEPCELGFRDDEKLEQHNRNAHAPI